jgi:hypothetical protein
MGAADGGQCLMDAPRRTQEKKQVPLVLKTELFRSPPSEIERALDPKDAAERARERLLASARVRAFIKKSRIERAAGRASAADDALTAAWRVVSEQWDAEQRR